MKTLPSDIERGSMTVIAEELGARGITLPSENAAVVMRCIHASADFDYAENLRFTPGAVQKAVEALRHGAEIVTDTNMALAGVSRPGLTRLGGAAYCFMAEPSIAAAAKERGTTRAVAAVDYQRADRAIPHRGEDRGGPAPDTGDRGAGGLCQCDGGKGAGLSRL